MLVKRRTLIFLALMMANSLVRKNDVLGNNTSPNHLNLPSFVNTFEVKSSIKGRIRFSVPYLKNNPMIASHLIEQVKKIQVIKKCTVNVALGTVLVEYNSNVVDAQTIEGALIKILGIDAMLDEGRVGEVRIKAREVVDAVNNGIYDYSNGILDIKSIALLLFLSGAVYDIRKLGVRRLPGYATLLWWSSSLF